MNINFNLFNILEFRNLTQILEKKENKNLFYLFIFMIVSSLLEVLSIGIVIPLISYLLNVQMSESYIFSFIPEFSKNYSRLFFINVIIFLIIFIYFIKYTFLIFYNFFQAKVILQINASIQKKLFSNYLKLEYTSYLNTNSALLIRNVQTEVGMLVSNFLGPFLSFWLLLTTTILILTLLFFYSFISTLVVLFIFGFVGIGLSFFLRDKLTIIAKKRQLHSYQYLKNLKQGLALFSIIKLLSLEKFFLAKFNFHNDAMVPLGVNRAVYATLPKVLFEFILIIIIFISITYINYNQLSFDKFLVIFGIYSLAAFRMIPTLNGLAITYQQIKYGVPSAHLIFNELNKLNAKVSFKNKINLPPNSNFQFNNEIGTFELGNLKIEIKALTQYQKQLIVCKK